MASVGISGQQAQSNKMSDTLLRSQMSHDPPYVSPTGDVAPRQRNGKMSQTNASSPPSSTSSGYGAQAANSPLQLFVRAKRKINEIYGEVGEYVSSAHRFLTATSSGVASDLEVVSAENEKLVADFDRKVSGIREVLRRDHMKVVFFGRTSNGKSTAINALLGDRILPMGIGHTTSCFLQIEGTDEKEAYAVTEVQPDQRQSLTSVSQLANALCEEKLDASAKVRILWPKEKCPMLAQEVVIIDSPGIDVESDLDDWIDKFCLDSDVFVLVANAESTLMLTEKKFFHKVSERLSNPNIFIIHNRSDAFAGEEMQHEVKAQHSQRAQAFLVQELNVCHRSEAEDRIYFISAKEALQARLQEAKGQPPQISTEDFFTRYLEFQKFEKNFASCLSSTAVKTKFAQHTARGQSIVNSVSQILLDIHQVSQKRQQSQVALRKAIGDRLTSTEKQLELMTQEMKEKIHQITEDVEYKVGKAMSEEIRRLSVLVDEFNDPFHPDPLVINVYKSKLNHHIENGLGSNLKARLSSDLQVNMDAHQQEMIERMSALIPEDRQQISRNILPRREAFEVLYHLHCDNLCSDFQEDLRFHFSLGLTSLIQRFMGGHGGHKRPHARSGDSSLSRSLNTASSPHTPPSNEFIVPQDDWSLVSKIAIASLTSQGTMGGLLAGGLLFKTVGWRVILVTGAVYGSLYFYERLTWTTQAKCRAFKQQYVDHAARKLRLIVDMTSANCSHQVQQELSSTFARLCHLVDENTNDMKDEIKTIDRTLRDLEESASRSKVLRNQASFIANKLDIFEQTFLAEDEN